MSQNILRMAMCQLNFTVGAITENRQKIADAVAKVQNDVDLVLFPEMALSGYQLQDMVQRPDLLRLCYEAANGLAREFAEGPAILLGCPWQDAEGGRFPDRVQNSDMLPIFNSILLLHGGEVKRISDKVHLPNEGVFDEKRIFAEPDHISGPIGIGGVRIGVMVCHDLWFADVAETQAESGAEILISLLASPFERDKADVRLQEALNRVLENNLPMMVLNIVLGQDGTVFDGKSFVLNRDCARPVLMPAFREVIYTTLWQKDQDGWACVDHQEVWQGEPPCMIQDLTGSVEELDTSASVYQAICFGLREFVHKNGFAKVLLGLSGGVDSALVATIAADALGSENVIGVRLPSPFTAQQSLDDAETLAKNLGIALYTLSIADLMQGYQDTIKTQFTEGLNGLAFENVQSRIRGGLLMSLSNQFSAMLLTTGNKSELAVGYCTLYGDTCGAINPIADLYKTEVYALCDWRNAQADFILGAGVIPQAILDRPPSAELSADQKDSDSLPEYVVLDDILRGIIEENLSIAEIVARGHDKKTVIRCFSLLDGAQHKRTQACVGVKLGNQSLKPQWRYPITNHFRQLDFS